MDVLFASDVGITITVSVLVTFWNIPVGDDVEIVKLDAGSPVGVIVKTEMTDEVITIVSVCVSVVAVTVVLRISRVVVTVVPLY